MPEARVLCHVLQNSNWMLEGLKRLSMTLHICSVGDKARRMDKNTLHPQGLSSVICRVCGHTLSGWKMSFGFMFINSLTTEFTILHQLVGCHSESVLLSYAVTSRCNSWGWSSMPHGSVVELSFHRVHLLMSVWLTETEMGLVTEHLKIPLHYSSLCCLWCGVKSTNYILHTCGLASGILFPIVSRNTRPG